MAGALTQTPVNGGAYGAPPDLPVLQLQTQQLMTSQIRSHIEYLIDLLYSCAHFIVKIEEKFSLNVGFNAI